MNDFDVFELLRALARHEVDYVVIGGVAVQAHGHRRTTMDLDVVPAPTPANLERLAAALEELHARPRDLPGAEPPTAEQLATIAPPLATAHGVLRILREPTGAPSYAVLRERALVIDLSGIKLAVAGRDDLIAMKRAAGRPRDLEDIAVLTTPE